MTGRSLRIRLLLAAAMALVIALGLAGVALSVIFERNVLTRVDRELEGYLRQLANLIEVEDGTRIVVTGPLSDPRFADPLGTLYWQLTADGAVADVSPSLWDRSLPIDPGGAHAAPKRHIARGPKGTEVVVVDRTISLQTGATAHELHLAAAMERAEIDDIMRSFRRELALSLALLACALMAAVWLQVGIGLRPLEHLRRNLAAVRKGNAQRLERAVPDEVAPLVDEVNDLIETQEASVRRARGRAADLAHGLKTPLTVMRSIVRDLQAQGQSASANVLSEQVAGMQRHVERELVRARIADTRNPRRIALAPIVERLVGVMRLLPNGDVLSWQIEVPATTEIVLDQDDANEMFGNLLENAVKWSRTTVRIHAAGPPGTAVVTVEDDGPGIPEEQFATALERGGRLDTVRPGNGLGLAIVRDIANAYGLHLSLYRAPLGGLGVRVAATRPDAAAERAPITT